MNKRGIMVSFLTTLLLAIIIFAPACIIASKMFRLSDQAKDNFGDFVKVISSLEEEEKKSFMLKMDEGTAIIGFNQKVFQSCMKEKELKVCGKWQAPNVKECEEGSCVCLIRNIVPTRDKVKKSLPGLREVEYKSAICKKVGAIFDTPRYEKKIEGAHSKEYFSKNGFVLGRNIPDSEDYMVMKIFDYNSRRNLVHLMKKEGKVFVCWEGNCEGAMEVIEGESEESWIVK